MRLSHRFPIIVSLGLLMVFSIVTVDARAGQWTGYVAAQDPAQLVPFSTGDHSVGEPISLSDDPRGIAIAPDAKTVYVTVGYPDRLIPVDVETRAEVTAIPLPNPVGPVAITPDGTTAYVASINAGLVYPIDLRTRTVGFAISIGHQAWDLAVHPDGKSLYVSTSSNGGVSRVDLISGTVSRVGDTGSSMAGIAFNPDGSSGYATAPGLNEVVTFNVGSDDAVLGAKPFGGLQPGEIAITPDGAKGFVTNFSSDQIRVLYLKTTGGGKAIDVGANPSDLAVAPDGATAYVANMDSKDVTPVNVASDTTGSPIAISAEAAPRWIAITPNQPPTARLSAGEALSDTPVRLDASASTDRDGSIASYEWDFGDGKSAVTDGPVVEHTYTKGSYVVSVTLTDDAGCSTEIVFTGQTASCNGSAAISRAELSLAVTDPVDDAPGHGAGDGGDDAGDGGDDAGGPDAPGAGGSPDATPKGGAGADRLNGTPARIGRIKVAPRRRAVKPGAKFRFAVGFRNFGDRPSGSVRICVRAPRRLVVPVRCRTVRRIPAARATNQRFILLIRRSARPGMRFRVRFRVAGEDIKPRSVRAVLRVR